MIEEKVDLVMSMERNSRFEGFETDEITGEVLVPRAFVGTTGETSGADGYATGESTYIPAGLEEEELPVLQFDFDFGEEEFADPEQEMDEDMILQSIDEALAAQMAVALRPEENEKKPARAPKKKKSVWKRIPGWCKATMISLATICLILGFFIGTQPGRKIVIGMLAGYIDENIGREPETQEPLTGAPEIVTPVPTSPVENPGNNDPQPTSIPMVEPRHEEHVYNILLIGTEALPQFGGERSDSMILVSVNSKDKKIYMTSMMRDMYVQIPGHSDAKLNAAYSSGGAKLLVETIEQNLQVKIDGYVKVGFESFEWIIDRLGGVEITLTAEEAAYLRRTNYISNPANRTVVAGTQTLNGNQALGYCRVRYVPTASGAQNDFGRTERQRTVLTKLFNKYKDTNVFTLLSVLNDCLPQVLTDISKADMQMLMETVIDNRILTLESFRIPVSGTFDDVYVGSERVLLITGWAKNIDELHKKIFGSVQ